jgi:hypothetical protein
MSASTSPLPVRDPYEFHPDEVVEPPRSFFGILRRIGPGIILSASIVGSGELIADDDARRRSRLHRDVDPSF